jgi:hypothetical protein
MPLEYKIRARMHSGIFDEKLKPRNLLFEAKVSNWRIQNKILMMV